MREQVEGLQKKGFQFFMKIVNKFISFSRSLTNSQKDEMPSVYSMFLLLLDFAENVICSLDEFGVVIRLITKLFSGLFLHF